MFNHFINCTCTEETVFSSYNTAFGDISASDDDNEFINEFIEISPNAEKRTYCPFDKIDEIVDLYLGIGYLKHMGINYRDEVMRFVASYGMPRRNTKKLSITQFAEDAELLYLHLSEVCTDPYPENPEWVLEPTPAAPVPVTKDGNTAIMWQTENLANAIELGYTLMLASDKKITMCKHCRKPYVARNPKREFCSPECRNSYNVRRHRERNS